VNYLLAIVLRDEGVQRQRAVGLFNAALGLGFDEFWVRYNRGVLLRDMGDRERAAEDFSVAAGMRPDFKFAVDAARSLAKLP
jgi:tetratricopeptide (TPR) repeat protein